jgi:hypothetical protein
MAFDGWPGRTAGEDHDPTALLPLRRRGASG